LPSSKHLHIVLAFPNVWYSKLTSRGAMQNMPEIQQEVGSMLGLLPASTSAAQTEIPEFGAKDIFGLSWKTLLDAYSCTECGRCTAQCPANLTGKLLSPRKIMMDIRDRTEEVALKLDSGALQYVATDKRVEGIKLTTENFDDGKSLFDAITPEEIHACTTCNACVEACPVLIDPLTPILELRRYEVLTQGGGAPDWLPMFNSLENTGAVWQLGSERQAWAQNAKD
jgi:Fe-S oxidoreductase